MAAKVPNLLHITSQVTSWPLLATPSYWSRLIWLLCGIMSWFSFSLTIHFLAHLSVHLLFHSCSRWVPQFHQAFNIRHNLDKNILLAQIPPEPQSHLPTWYPEGTSSTTCPKLNSWSSPSPDLVLILCPMSQGQAGGQPRVGGGGSCICTHSLGLGKQWVLTYAEFKRNKPCHPLPKNNCDLLGGHNKLTSAITSSPTYIPFSPRDATPWA